jgi:hypothetical protein
MRPNFEVRLRTVAHLALAQGHPCTRLRELEVSTTNGMRPKGREREREKRSWQRQEKERENMRISIIIKG